ncbi:MAG: hypothetical protein WC413_04530 [Candidatus Nanoarchaeia archaeon]
MKKSNLLILFVLIFSLAFMSACTVQLSGKNLPKINPSCCVVTDVNNGGILGCVQGFNLKNSQSECYNKFFSLGNTQWASDYCDKLPQCQDTTYSCMGYDYSSNITYQLVNMEGRCVDNTNSYLCSNGTISLISTNGCVTPQGCLDSDDGINIYVKAKGGLLINGTWGYNEEMCYDSNFGIYNDAPEGCTDYTTGHGNGLCVLEMFCDALNQQQTRIYKCPNGCSNGACLSVTNETCTDTDGGIDYLNFGVISNNTMVGTFSDSCISSLDGDGSNVYEGDRIVEYFCGNGGEWSFSLVTCEYGCRNGTCVKQYDPSLQKYYVNPSSNLCTDTDSSINYYGYFTKGNITHYNPYNKVNESFGDGCMNDPIEQKNVYEGDYLGEANCRGSFYDNFINYSALSVDIFKCPNGCVNGACFLTNSKVISCDRLIYHPEQNDNEPTILDRINFCKNNGLYYAGIMLEGDQFHWYGNCLDDPNNGWGYITDLRICNYKSCVDSDNGINYSIKGVVQGYANSPSIPFNLTDTCLLEDGSNVLAGPNIVEGICEDGFWAFGNIYTCPNGCYDGVCITQCQYTLTNCPSWSLCSSSGGQYCAATGCNVLLMRRCSPSTCPQQYTETTCPSWTACDQTGYKYCAVVGCSSLSKKC